MFIIKIYNGHFSTTPSKQIEDISSLSLEEDLLNFSIAKIGLNYSTNTNGLTKYQKVGIYKVTTTDEKLFEGYIYEILPNINGLTLTIRSYKALFQKKILFTDKSYTSQTLDSIVSDLISESNGRTSGDFVETWTTDIESFTGITKDYKQGDNYYDIFNELAVLSGKQWIVNDGIIYFKDIIGTDRTTGTDYLQLRYDVAGPQENNIININIEDYGTISTSIIGDDGTSTSTKTDSTSQGLYGYLEEFKTFREGNIATQTQEYLDLVKNNVKLLKITPDSTDTTLLDTQIGDKLSLYINTNNNYLDFDGDINIISTKKELDKSTLILKDIGLSEINLQVDTFINKLNDITAQIKKLQLN